jgi:phospholipid/cholesterol/gamma-HCH transport system ATP-binding protein
MHAMPRGRPGLQISAAGSFRSPRAPRASSADPNELRDRATALCCAFGLPGLPLVRPGELAASDLARAACVRAFLGDPALVLLESPVQGRFTNLMPPLLNALAAARDRGAAAIWFTRSDLVWRDPSVPATMRLRLGERGLAPTMRAA